METWNIGPLRLADVVDIAIISVVVYLLLGWLRQRGSRSALVALILAVVVYTAARLLHLYLTLLLFQAGLTVALVALVLVFQEDFRRLVSRIGTYGFFPAGPPPSPGGAPDALTEALFALAEEKIGALVVLRGREPLESHVDGGTRVDGRISVPLLYSIFHPASPGHDGAVLIDGDRIERFGVHLPLSRNLEEVGEAGTRHTAALGLAERTDATVIIVSEERGTIRVAERDRLEAVASAAELRRLLDGYYERRYPKHGGRRRAWTANLGTKLASVSVAILLWFVVVYNVQTVQRTHLVPIEYRNVPADWVVEDPVPTEARVTLSGSEAMFSLFRPGAAALSLDLSRIREGQQEIVITDEGLGRPPNLIVDQIDPPVVFVRAYRLVETKLPVEVQTEGKLPDGYVLVVAKATPAAVRVLAPRGESETFRFVRTEAVDITGATGSVQRLVGLVAPRNARFPGQEPPKVRVDIEIARQKG